MEVIVLENIDILAKAKEDLKDIERKLWIQAYVSRKENPLIDLICSALLLICSYLAFYRYFTEGVAFSFWMHVGAFITVTICMAIAHRFLNRHFTDKAEKLCPITSSTFNTEEICSMERLDEIASHGYFDQGKVYHAGPFAAFFSIIALVFCFFALSRFAKLPVPSGCVLYLIIMCIVTGVWFFFAGFAFSQSLSLPLSLEVRSALHKYKKEKTQETKLLHKAELKKAKLEQDEKERLRAEAEQKAEEDRRLQEENAPKLYRDLPIYQQYREEARRRYIGYSSSGSYNRTLTYAEKYAYVNRKFSGMYSYSAIETIENDPDLSLSQKEDLKTFLMTYGD